MLQQFCWINAAKLQRERSRAMRWNGSRKTTGATLGNTLLEKLHRNEAGWFLLLTIHKTADFKGGYGTTAVRVDPVAPRNHPVVLVLLARLLVHRCREHGEGGAYQGARLGLEADFWSRQSVCQPVNQDCIHIAASIHYKVTPRASLIHFFSSSGESHGLTSE